jgi:putative phage-type endonuclease
MEQRTEDWFAVRLGKVTASKIADVVAKTKTGYSASRANYMAQLVVERLTGVKEASFTNDAMQWGIDKEPEARAAWEAKVGELVEEVGFIHHPTILMSGASPDGLVNDDGMVEIKCPNTATMLDYILDKTVPQKYLYQMQWQMACANKEWCDFVAYDPRLPENLRLLVIRVKRDNEMIAMLETEVKKFLTELDDKVTALKEAKL